MENSSRYIISLELNSDSISMHLIKSSQSRTTTMLAKNLMNKNDIELILDKIIKNDFPELIKWFKDKYDLMHQMISFSYGPHIRKYISAQRTPNTVISEPSEL